MSGFKIGDVVQLKSGGPAMTVIGIDTSNINGNTKVDNYKCQWFAEGVAMQCLFVSGALIKYVSEPLSMPDLQLGPRVISETRLEDNVYPTREDRPLNHLPYKE